MASHGTALQAPARISKIADRFLVFDADHVAQLRRAHNISSVLVGSTPQNPTQNVFLSLPLELLPEEAGLLLNTGAAVLADEASSHLDALRSGDRKPRDAYLDQLRDRRQQAKKLLTEGKAAKAVHSKELELKSRATSRKNKMKKEAGPNEPTPQGSSLFGEEQKQGPRSQQQSATGPRPPEDDTMVGQLTVTPTTSSGLCPGGETRNSPASQYPPVSLHQLLVSRGYFMTPGLRFGARYSVYPGDPLRYHAHFLATDYTWDEEIPILDIVASGRLGTSVKKGFLMGGEESGMSTSGGGSSHARAFCVEWAGM